MSLSTGCYVWNPQYLSYELEYIERFFEQIDTDGRRWKRGDLAGAGVRKGESGLPWRGIDPTKKGGHWALPRGALAKLGVEAGTVQERLEKLDTLGLVH